MPMPPAPPAPIPPPAASPRRQFALVTAAGLAVVLLAFLCMRFEILTRDRTMAIPVAALLGWVAVGVGLFGVLFGAKSNEILYRVLRIPFIVLIAFPGMFATVALSTKRPEPPPDPPPTSPVAIDPDIARIAELARALESAQPIAVDAGARPAPLSPSPPSRRPTENTP